MFNVLLHGRQGVTSDLAPFVVVFVNYPDTEFSLPAALAAPFLKWWGDTGESGQYYAAGHLRLGLCKIPVDHESFPGGRNTT